MSEKTNPIASVLIIENMLLKRVLFIGMLVLPVLFIIATYYKMQDMMSNPTSRMIFALGACFLGYMAFRLISQLSKLKSLKVIISRDSISFFQGPTIWGKGEWMTDTQLKLDNSVKLMAKKWNFLLNGCIIISHKKDSWFFSSSWFKGVNNTIAFFEENKIKFETLQGGEIKRYRNTIRKKSAA